MRHSQPEDVTPKHRLRRDWEAQIVQIITARCPHWPTDKSVPLTAPLPMTAAVEVIELVRTVVAEAIRADRAPGTRRRGLSAIQAELDAQRNADGKAGTA